MAQAPEFPQLALNFRWDAGADLAGFVEAGNEAAVAAIRALGTPAGQWLYLSGPAGSGKSHLLQAACGRIGAAGGTAVYLPLRDHIQRGPALLDGLEQVALVAIDDLEVLAGQPQWEEAVFHCHNRLRDAGGMLLAAARGTPGSLGLALPDLVSRLQALLAFRLTPPDDARRRRILTLALARRGLTLPGASIDYLLVHETRDMPHLMALVQRLDEASLRTGRRLTVPFIKSVLGR